MKAYKRQAEEAVSELLSAQMHSGTQSSAKPPVHSKQIDFSGGAVKHAHGQI